MLWPPVVNFLQQYPKVDLSSMPTTTIPSPSLPGPSLPHVSLQTTVCCPGKLLLQLGSASLLL
jgi:hypothetical protein